MQGNRSEANRLELVQALRALAALSVVLGHALHETLSFPGMTGGSFSTFVMDRSGAGVDLFFAISGFVMIYASQKLFATQGAGWKFLFRRIARIVPLYWAVTSLFLLVLAASPALLSSGAPTPGEIIKSYLFIPFSAPGTALAQPVYKLGWTLNYEMLFYTLLACMIALPRRRAVAALLIVLSTLVVAGAFIPAGSEPASFWTHPIILEFGAGALLASLYIDGVRLPAKMRWILAALAILWLSLAPVPEPGTVYGTARPLLWGIPAILILAGATLSGNASLRSALARPAILLGDASYSIYLLHPIIIRALRVFWDKMGLSAGLPPWLFILSTLIATIIISVIAYRWFERPLTTWLQRWGGRTATPSVSRVS
ncbi:MULTISPECIES: acyltransferase [unclassified Beijerinckia]|uniref:acyltransferase family protein n=1 Tax=unclassified Beijerinckia TaxID=2638183 RepID=UPI000896C9CA|nr:MULTISPECIES: acyltransferase [unclassified Beijerinckia]MDH7794755.1 exopolysaccharide production protein ExoZ [Beijerinckia sp. GAS462]SEB73962.1 Peptidoglycan/LPS O-acetylase OafA/YrhL, contains acyltransferase and SGNH-hydrolase domains [Beijerinckia sp. 28-YEA-48]